MSILCGWASIDERGRARGGTAGDQTGGEVKVGYYYQFGQNVVLRPTDRATGVKMAEIMRKICYNNKVGYDQDERTTLYKEMARVGWDPDKITKPVETDCSALIAVVCRSVGISVSPDIWTGNMREALSKTGKFRAFTGTGWTNTDKNLRKGDIILNPAAHVIMAIEDGPDADKGETSSVPQPVGTATVYVYGSHGSGVNERWALDSSRSVWVPKKVCHGYKKR